MAFNVVCIRVMVQRASRNCDLLWALVSTWTCSACISTSCRECSRSTLRGQSSVGRAKVARRTHLATGLSGVAVRALWTLILSVEPSLDLRTGKTCRAVCAHSQRWLVLAWHAFYLVQALFVFTPVPERALSAAQLPSSRKMAICTLCG